MIVNADTRESVALLNPRMAYVVLCEDGLIYTNSMAELTAVLERRRDKAMALEMLRDLGKYHDGSHEWRLE